MIKSQAVAKPRIISTSFLLLDMKKTEGFADQDQTKKKGRAIVFSPPSPLQ
jgi:hypothetical protein